MSKRVGSLLFIILSVGIASSISLLGGLGIEAVEHKLLAIVPLLIALPGMNDMVGDYATLIAAHAGDPEERTRSKRELLKAMLPSIGINTFFVLVVSQVFAWERGYHFTAIFMIKFAAFVVIAIAAVIAIMFLITTVLDAMLEKRAFNPDDVLIPIVTTISDIFMLSLIALAAVFLF